ncbi:MAG TPA: hypothetical protein VHU89_08755 [Acidobacteriaceae bacterium]|jgi:hypothetical protein|nr:hypothetical protein [Acidobacteriaceae bacterium]
MSTKPIPRTEDAPAIAVPLPSAALIITAAEGVEEIAAMLAQKLGLAVEVGSTRGAALRLLERRAYALVVLDQILADGDPQAAEMVWRCAGLAIPLQINFALAGSVRLEREMRAALIRRQREQQMASVAAAAAVDAALKNAVTGILLESRLALAEEGLPPGIESRLRTLAGIANQMRERLGAKVLPDTTPVPLSASRE